MKIKFSNKCPIWYSIYEKPINQRSCILSKISDGLTSSSPFWCVFHRISGAYTSHKQPVVYVISIREAVFLFLFIYFFILFFFFERGFSPYSFPIINLTSVDLGIRRCLVIRFPYIYWLSAAELNSLPPPQTRTFLNEEGEEKLFNLYSPARNKREEGIEGKVPGRNKFLFSLSLSLRSNLAAAASQPPCKNIRWSVEKIDQLYTTKRREIRCSRVQKN